MIMAAPSGVVTFLFTDIEGSTRRWEAEPDEMRLALAVHDEVLRKAIEAHGGWLFKHTGDGVRGIPVTRAVDAAVVAQGDRADSETETRELPFSPTSRRYASPTRKKRETDASLAHDPAIRRDARSPSSRKARGS